MGCCSAQQCSTFSINSSGKYSFLTHCFYFLLFIFFYFSKKVCIGALEQGGFVSYSFNYQSDSFSSLFINIDSFVQ